MAIISAGYPRISPDRPASIDAIQWSRMAQHLGSPYWVSEGSWDLSVPSGSERTVTVGTGTGGGHGVQDEATEPEPVQFEALNSGTRWDTVAARRDWANATTEFVALRGGTARNVSARREQGPGSLDDQPLYLVQLQAVTGGVRIGTIRDIRAHAGPGGIIAQHSEAMSYLTKPGTRLHIMEDASQWFRALDASGAGVWQQMIHESTGTISPSNSTWLRPLRWVKQGRNVTVTMNVLRDRDASTLTSPTAASTLYHLPAHLRPETILWLPSTSPRSEGSSPLYTVVFESGGRLLLQRGHEPWHIGPDTAYHLTASYRTAN